MPGDKPGKEEKKMGRTETKTKDLTAFEYQRMIRTMTQKQIAELYGITPSALWRWGKRHNVILTRITDWEIAEEIWEKTPKQLAYEYNMSLSAIYRRLKIMGICTKQPGQRGGTK